MTKRVLGGFLWFLTASYGWGFFSAMTGILPVAALPIGILVGTFVIADPLGVVWSVNRRARSTNSTHGESASHATLAPEAKA